MNINLAYGRGYLPVNLPKERTTVISPAHRPGLPNEKAEFIKALENPIAARPLRDWVKPGDRVCISFTDRTRATPNERLIPWILEHLADVPRENIILLNQLGTHRPNTQAELEEMLTPEVVRNYKVVNHEAKNEDALVQFGTMSDGTPALINRHLAEADVRIVTGFIEPHFFAGFSGGPKGIIPGCAGLRSVIANHSSRNVGHPNSVFGVLDGNPLWEELLEVALRIGPSFLVNVTLNDDRAITGVFAGDLVKAHRAGCEFVRTSAMQKVSAPADIVVTTNSGFPLDQNLYQGVKGMSAGVRILKPGGTMILACECADGLPANSHYQQLLREAPSPEQALALLSSPGFLRPEQWQAQIQALIQQRAKVLIYSSLPDDVVRSAWLTPCHDISATVRQLLDQLGPEARVAVLPQGPLTIPYLA